MRYEYYIIDEHQQEKGPFYRNFTSDKEALETLEAEGLFLSGVAVIWADGTKTVIYCPWG
jgi:hypothetical protein